eukprot:9308847-Lingulodinium_polyedra.AAC.1
MMNCDQCGVRHATCGCSNLNGTGTLEANGTGLTCAIRRLQAFALQVCTRHAVTRSLPPMSDSGLG